MGLGEVHAEVFETAVNCDDGERFTVLTREGDKWLASQWEARFLRTGLASYLYPQLLRMGAGRDVDTALRRMRRRQMHPRVA